MVHSTIITYNGIIFKLGTTLEKLIEPYSVELQAEIRWTLIKNWFAKLVKTHRQLIYEFSKLSQNDRDELLKQTLSSVFYKSVTNPNIGATARYIETVPP